MKRLAREQLQSRKEKAVRFLRDVLGDPERAKEIAEESLEDYARRRKIQLMNPERRDTMPKKTIEDYRAEVADLKDQLGELEEENESLQDQLDAIGDILVGEEEEEDNGYTRVLPTLSDAEFVAVTAAYRALMKDAPGASVPALFLVAVAWSAGAAWRRLWSSPASPGRGSEGSACGTAPRISRVRGTARH